MESIIKLQEVSKTFKVLNRHEGMKGSIRDLFSRDYKNVVAVNKVSMSVNAGEIVGYLGPNGAGKSTTIKMMTGILEPSEGSIRVNGRVPHRNRSANAQEIGVVFGQRSQLWWSLPVIESFKILKEIYAIPDAVFKHNMNRYEELVGISELYNKPVRQMSLGQRTLCDILASFLHDPPVVFLDEPTIGLDVSMKQKIRDLILSLNKEKNTTVILTTHDMGDVEALCRRIMIIDHGQKIYDDSIGHLKEFFGAYRTLKIMPEETGLLNEAKLDSYKAELLKVIPEAEDTVFTIDEDWLSILVPEDKIKLMRVVSGIQGIVPVRDIRIDEISTESVIRKIYEGEEAKKDA
jgi:ABC-2 type transport system ATP-binding protein